MSDYAWGFITGFATAAGCYLFVRAARVVMGLEPELVDTLRSWFRCSR
jgi:hypothetical protein